jgi:stress response protein YsnF
MQPQQQTLVALYSTRALAEDVRSKLRAAGIPESNIKLSADPDDGAAEGETGREPPHHEAGGLWDWLFGSEVPDEERERYSGRLRGGNIAVSVRSCSEAERDKVIGLMEQFDPIDIDGDDTTTTVPPTGIAGDLTGASPPLTGSAAFAATERRGAERQTVGSAQPAATDGGDQVIPIAQEELEIGKRQVERRHRIRTHVIETPVEEQVTLRDETVSVERRRPTTTQPASATGADAFQEREFEVVERDEEAVVSKQARVTEEVVVHKDVKERVETVRDTVRETRVDVDREDGRTGTSGGIDRAAAGNKPGLTSGPSGDTSGGEGFGFQERARDALTPSKKT